MQIEPTSLSPPPPPQPAPLPQLQPQLQPQLPQQLPQQTEKTAEEIKAASFNATLEVLRLFHSSQQSPQTELLSPLNLDEQANEKVKQQTEAQIVQQAPLIAPTGASLQLKATFNFLNLFHNLLTPKLLASSLTSNVETQPAAQETEEAQKTETEVAQKTETEEAQKTEAKEAQIVQQAPLIAPKGASLQLIATFNFLNLFHNLLTPKLLASSLTSNVETQPVAQETEAEEAQETEAEEAQKTETKEAQKTEAQAQIVQQAPLIAPKEASPQLIATFNFLNLFHS